MACKTCMEENVEESVDIGQAPPLLPPPAPANVSTTHPSSPHLLLLLHHKQHVQVGPAPVHEEGVQNVLGSPAPIRLGPLYTRSFGHLRGESVEIVWGRGADPLHQFHLAAICGERGRQKCGVKEHGMVSPHLSVVTVSTLFPPTGA